MKNKVVDELMKEIVDPLLNNLAQRGLELAEKAFATSEFTNRTYNLRDSYGYGVYYKGDLVRSGSLGSPMATEPRKWYGESISGRTELTTFLKEHKASKDKVQLIVFASMPYSVVLETGKRGNVPLKQKYSVIANMSQDMDKLASDYSMFDATNEFIIDKSNR